VEAEEAEPEMGGWKRVELGATRTTLVEVRTDRDAEG
jgi:hypothetical protein